jgi:hypothetical protein
MTNTLVISIGVLVMNERIGRQAARQGLAQKLLLGSGIFGAILGVGGGLLSGLDVTLPQPLVFGGSLVIVVALFWVSVIYWRNIDEAAREAHKFAWFWGGTGGMLVILPIATLISTERLVAVLGPHDPGEWVAFGFASLLIAQLLGYGLVWTGWWLRQR